MTTLQQLMNSFDNYQKESHNDSITIDKLKEVIINEYLQKEKQQIKEAWNAGNEFGFHSSESSVDCAIKGRKGYFSDEYYKNTYE